MKLIKLILLCVPIFVAGINVRAQSPLFNGGDGGIYFEFCFDQIIVAPTYNMYTGGQGNYNNIECYTQSVSHGNEVYNGGAGSIADVTCFIENDGSFDYTFYGGNGSSQNLSCFSQASLDTYTMFYGGNSSSYTLQCYEQIDLITGRMYQGGNGPNYFLGCYEEEVSFIHNLYTGGNGQLDVLSCFIQEAIIGERFFQGGKGDGFDVDCKTQENALGTMIYGGGNNNGFEFYCYQESNAETLNMFSGGISNSRKLKCFQQLDYLIIPLPIELLSFTALAVKKEILLSWVTSSEIDASHFEVERSGENLVFEYLDELDAIGNSNEETNYELLDHSPLKGVSYYRLKQIDNNGEFKYSKIIAVNFKKKDEHKPNLLIYPNPIIDKTTLQFNNFTDKEIVFSVYTVSGILILQQTINLSNGNGVYEFILPTRMVSGSYIITVEGLETKAKVSRKLIVN